MTGRALSLVALLVAGCESSSWAESVPCPDASGCRPVADRDSATSWEPVFTHRFRPEYERRTADPSPSEFPYAYREPLYSGSVFLPLPRKMGIDYSIFVKERPEHFSKTARRSNVAGSVTDYEYRFYQRACLSAIWGRHGLVVGRSGFSIGPTSDLFPQGNAALRPNRALSISNHIQSYDQVLWSYGDRRWTTRFFCSRIENSTALRPARETRDLFAREVVFRIRRRGSISLYETSLIDGRAVDLADLNPLLFAHNLNRRQTNTITGITSDFRGTKWRLWSELAMDDVHLQPVEPKTESPSVIGLRVGLRLGNPTGLLAGVLEIVHTDPWFGNRESEGLRYRRLTDDKYSMNAWEPIGYWNGPDRRDLEAVLQCIPARWSAWWIELSLRQSGEISLETPYLETGRPKRGTPTGVVQRENRLAVSTRIRVLPGVALSGAIGRNRIADSYHRIGLREESVTVRLGMELSLSHGLGANRGRPGDVRILVEPPAGGLPDT